MSEESTYAGLLESLGFIKEDEPDEESKEILAKLPNLPAVPLILKATYEDPTEVLTLVIDELGQIWGKMEIVGEETDLSPYNFGDYIKFCASGRHRLN